MFRRELGESGPMVSSPRQEAVLMTDGQRVRVILRTHFARGPREVAWVLPVPARPTDIRAEQEGLFEELERETAPRFTMRHARKSGFACSSAAEHGGMALDAPMKVLETGSAGMYDYAVLSARDGAALRGWLNANGYLMPPGAGQVLDAYTRDNWHWLAMKLRPGDDARPTLAPRPITYTYKDTRLVFPMVISRISAAPRNEIVLYILARQKHEATNWSNATVRPETIEHDHRSPSGTTYEKLFDDLARRERHVFVTEYANRPHAMPPKLAAATRAFDPVMAQPGYLTRLRTIIRPDDMDRDILLGPARSTGQVNNHIQLSDAGTVRVMDGGLILMAGLAAGVLLTARPRTPRPECRAASSPA
jgi:hypothetical protein